MISAFTYLLFSKAVQVVVYITTFPFKFGGPVRDIKMDMLTKIALNDFPLVTHFPYIVISTSGGN